MKRENRYDLGNVRGRDERLYRAIAIGRPRSDDMWEGFLEFVDPSDLSSVVTDVETTQPNADAFRYWAEGVGIAFLEGALERARRRAAEGIGDRNTETVAGTPGTPAVLNPFEVYEQGVNLLLDQLAALETERVRDIVRSYELATPATVESLSRTELIAAIFSAVQAGQRRQTT